MRDLVIGIGMVKKMEIETVYSKRRILKIEQRLSGQPSEYARRVSIKSNRLVLVALVGSCLVKNIKTRSTYQLSLSSSTYHL